MKKRVDVLLVERGLAESRAQAQALVQRLEETRRRLESTQDAEAATEVLSELAEIAREIETELAEARRRAEEDAREKP